MYLKYIKVITVFIITITILVIVTACEKNEGVENDGVVNVLELNDKPTYKMKSPIKQGVARGLIVKNIDNRQDIDEIELTLLEFSKDHFSPEKLYFQEGQYLSEDIINSWLKRKSKDTEEGLNPPINNTGNPLEDEKSSPIILSHILEQNFVTENGDLKGISLGISLNEYYNIRVSDKKGLIYTDRVKVDQNDNEINDVKRNGKKMAEEIVKRIRMNNSIPDVPIYLTLYRYYL